MHMARYDFTDLVNNVVNDVMNSVVDSGNADMNQIRLMASIAAQASALTLIRTGLIPKEYEI